MEQEIQSAYQEELQRLKHTVAEIDRQLQTLQGIPRYYGDDLTEQALDNIRENMRRNLAISTHEPYFGRLDFQEEGQEAPTPLYIGKVGVEDDKTGQLLVIDWRAPVASMFYSFTGGDEPAAYESPEDGTIAGLIYLKRNLVIRQQILQRVVDAYTKGGDNLGVADEFLLYRLEENKDNRLRDIVSTIQEEQDRIIRSAKNSALVIQGVAGSGKTTVALHRLAYLLYQYRENIRAEKMIIFAPNSMFLDYISGVLPELGVGGIQQTTFSDWALSRLDDRKITLADPADQYAYWFAIGNKRPLVDDTAPGRFKGAVAFMHYLDDCLNRYERDFVPDADYEPWDGVVLKAETVYEWYHTEYQHYPLAKRRDRVSARIKRWLEIELDKVWEVHLKKDLKKTAQQRLKTYLKKWPDHTAFTFYKDVFATAKRPAYLPETLLEAIPASIIESSNRLFKKKQVAYEDLAPLIYIHNRLHGIEGNDFFDHVVIDEAQDFSPFQVALLKEQTRGNSFTILGDLSQGIHAYQGVRSWQEDLDLFSAEEQGFFRLERSYRSTMEIIHFANEVIHRSGEEVTLAKPVFRSGEQVKVAKIGADQRVDTVLRAVHHLQGRGASTVAVIGRTDEECQRLHAELGAAGLDATLIHSGQREYRGGLSVLPVYLSKGLEFDAVILTDVDSEHYAQTALDAKLLYVGCTRALHHLWLLHEGDESPLIQGLDPELYSSDLGM